jgi:hypothetical protein
MRETGEFALWVVERSTVHMTINELNGETAAFYIASPEKRAGITAFLTYMEIISG